MKLMYLADRESLKGDSGTITGDDYCSLDKGPVPVRLYALATGGGELEAQDSWDALFKREGDDLVLLKDDILFDWISEYDTDMLAAVDARFGGRMRRRDKRVDA